METPALISLLISFGALIVSAFALYETVHARRTRAKEKLLQRKIEMCNQAVELISFDASGMAPGTISFNKKIAAERILYKNLLNLNHDQLSELLNQYETINDDYQKVSGQKLGFNNLDLGPTCALYSREDFPPRLNSFYNEICKLVVEHQKTLQKEKEEFEKHV